MNYDGGKNGEGVYHAIINQMPPHRVYIEAFLGSGAIIRRKRLAAVNIAIEKDPLTIAAVKPLLSSVDLYHGCAVDWLRDFLPVGGDVLVYADPPYLRSVRSCQRDLYRCEFATEAEHICLLQLAKSSTAMWIISGYWSPLYAEMLSGWRTVQFEAATRAGMRTEFLWCNFREPFELHDYSFLGVDRIDRQRIKRKKQRWVRKLRGMSPLERNAVYQACDAVKSEMASLPVSQSELSAGPSEVISDYSDRKDGIVCSRSQIELSAPAPNEPA
jgi:DNA adenine methylase